MDNNNIINGSSAQIIELNPELRNIGYADGININGALNDEEKLDYKNAPCCNPIPGDKVFGFITINDGIKIHKKKLP